jgi:hypothetical protein
MAQGDAMNATRTAAQEIARERRLMTTFATRHHAEHGERRDDFCRKCQTEALHEWARKEGLIP